MSRLLAHVAELIRLRGELARAEVNRTARRTMVGAGLAVAAFSLVVAAGPIAIVVLILLLSTMMPPWAAAAIMLVVTLLVAGVLLLIARRLLTIRLGFLADVKADVRTIRSRVEVSP
ncbi:MAG TPA: phage holin family protein [bacterium]|jgi:hypothetical protein